MKIAIIQSNSTPLDLKGNSKKITDKTLDCDSRMVVFGEGALTGLPLLDMENSEQFEQEMLELLGDIAIKTSGYEVFIGLGNYRIAYLAAGAVQLIDSDYVQIADAVVFMQAEQFSHGKPSEMLRLMREEADKQALTVIWVNHVGASTGDVYFGGSIACYSTGETITLPLWEECTREIDTAQAKQSLESWGEGVEQTHLAIRLAIRDYFDKNGFGECCIALSGGIDSAVVVALAVEALGSERVRVVMLPSGYSSDHSVEDSVEMARRCGVRYDIVSIEEIFRTALGQIEHLLTGEHAALAEENMQARIRLMMTMALCNQSNALMLNTSNKSEVAVGYGTLYGDTSGALGVIADLYKGEVYELANYMNTLSEPGLIPQNIIDKAPSAELRPGQKDSDSLPDYPLLDAVLYRLVEQRMSLEEILAQGYPEQQVRRIARMLWNGDFKRAQLPPAISLSGATFNRHYRMPITKVRYV